MIGFQLGREFKLSIAEILNIFNDTKIVFFNKDILLLEGLNNDSVIQKAKVLGGTIKIIDFKNTDSEININEYIFEKAEFQEGKFKYGVSIFGEKSNLKKILMSIKKNLRENKISSRFVNKDFTNLSSAQIIGENLVKRGSDFTIIFHSPEKKRGLGGEVNNIYYIGETIWVQDIKSYSDRDYSKQRDMQVGMLPPKLSQMMINLSGGNVIYDPFVGLGTILIESLYMGNSEVYGTDLNDKMVEVSNENINKLKNTFTFNHEINKLNAKFIEESEFLKKSNCIVTEGYLGEVMTKSNISVDRIKKQRESLTKIYEAFFAGLKKMDFKGNIVICFPFWEIKGNYLYFNEIYDILNKYCNILNLLPKEIDLKATKSGSLLYKRPNQLVGREIFKLTIK